MCYFAQRVIIAHVLFRLVCYFDTLKCVICSVLRMTKKFLTLHTKIQQNIKNTKTMFAHSPTWYPPRNKFSTLNLSGSFINQQVVLVFSLLLQEATPTIIERRTLTIICDATIM